MEIILGLAARSRNIHYGSKTKKAILIAAALAPLTLSPVNSAPLSDDDFARADYASKIFIAVGELPT
jgi:hypothetical protein